MDFARKVRSLHAAKTLVLALGLYGVYALYTRFDNLASDGALMLAAGQRAAVLAPLRSGEKNFPRPAGRSAQEDFRFGYYNLGRALGERTPFLPVTRAFVENITPDYYALAPLAEDVFRAGQAETGRAAAREAFNKTAGRITRHCLEAAKTNTEARTLLLVATGLGYFLLFSIMLLLEWAGYYFVSVPFLDDISALNRKIWIYAAVSPALKLPGGTMETMRAGLDSLLAELRASRDGWARLEHEAAARQERIKIQTRSLELARKKVMALVEDLEEARTDLQKEKKSLKIAGAKLERSNKELEQFAYVASHDLKEPLRIVSSFSALLSKRYSSRLDADADDFMRYITEGAHRASELIEALFNYSKVTYSTREFTVVPAMTALQKAMFNLKLAIDEKKARIICDGLPPLKVNEFQLIQLFQNLIANSLKFNTAPEPEIRVGFSETPEAWTLHFSDNGIGIAPEHFERIFLVFQRLHQQNKYPGAGIGLALCKKIAENHGGRIWVESTPGGGSTFFVEFPKQAELETVAAGGPAPELTTKAGL